MYQQTRNLTWLEKQNYYLVLGSIKDDSIEVWTQIKWTKNKHLKNDFIKRWIVAKIVHCLKIDRIYKTIKI
jgi:hypothetical protein